MEIVNLSQSKNESIPKDSDEFDDGVYSVKKGVVLFVLRRSLLETGNEAFEMVNRSLFEKYRCEISDCFEKPEYLVDVLKYVYNSSYATIVESMKQSLDRFTQDDAITLFLEKICRY